MSPTALLLATFIGTSAVALIAQVGRNDIYQARIICFGALVAVIAGVVRRVELINFIFAYLLWGCIAGVGGSWMVHRLLTLRKSHEEFLPKQTESEGKGENGMKTERI